MTKSQKLEEVLNKISSEEDRINILFGIIERSSAPASKFSRDSNLPNHLVLKSIKYLEQRKRLKEAAELASNIGCYRDKAVVLYERAKEFSRAAELYTGLGELDKAINLYERIRNFEKAGDLYRELNQTEKAIEAYEKGGLHIEAARLARETGNLEKTFELYSKIPTDSEFDIIFYEFQDVAKLAEEVGNIEKAIIFYERGWQTPSVKYAIKLAEKNGFIKKAINLCLKHGWTEDAADISIRHGFKKEVLKVLKNLEKKKDFFQAANIADKLGLYKKAILLYEREGQFEHAKDVAEKANLKEKTVLEQELIDLIFG